MSLAPTRKLLAPSTAELPFIVELALSRNFNSTSGPPSIYSSTVTVVDVVVESTIELARDVDAEVDGVVEGEDDDNDKAG
jgi:hypothetical protein